MTNSRVKQRKCQIILEHLLVTVQKLRKKSKLYQKGTKDTLKKFQWLKEQYFEQ